MQLGIDTRASYSKSHIVKALLIVSREPAGRFRLMDELGLGEASVKTLLKNLQKSNLIRSSPQGHLLSKKGDEIVKTIKSKTAGPIEIDAGEYAIKNHNVAVLIKKCAHKIKSGIEQRDEAIKSGALGATTLICENNKLKFPKSQRHASNLERTLRGFFNIENDDVVIITTSDNLKKSENAALGVALSLISSQ